MARCIPILVVAGLLAGAVGPASGQEPARHAHAPGMTPDPAGEAPAQVGQAGYAAIAEIVAILEQDPATDWSKVNLEALRQHLVDMDDVTLRAEVVTRSVEGGIEVLVTGAGRVAGAIRRMSRAHAAALAGESPYRMTVEDVAGGARVRVVAAPGSPPSVAVRIRGLGFIGILASGSHHAAHHLALARGQSPAGHRH